MKNIKKIFKENLNLVATKSLRQEMIGTVKDDIQVIIDVTTTNHAQERKYRHGIENYIENQEIRKAVDDAIQRIAQALIFDELDIQESFTIINKKFDPPLNIVGLLKKSGNKLRFVIITLMRKENFRPKQGTIQLVIDK